MKIIYSAGNRIGANSQLTRFLDNIDKNKHEVKVAAYLKSSYSIPIINWNLNAVHKNITKDNISIRDIDCFYYNKAVITQLLNDVANFNPDLIICDNEHIFASIANEMNIQLWHCSPMLLTEGIDWDIRDKLNYNYFINLDLVDKQVQPSAQKYLIYSPFCDVKSNIQLRTTRDDDWNIIYKYEWVRPYFYKINTNIAIDENKRMFELNNLLKYIDLKDCFFTDGNTDNLSDAIYNKKKIIISPSVRNKEALLNAVLLDKFNIGIDVAQVELMSEFSLEEIENAISLKIKNIELKKSNAKQLHEMINDFELAN